jgi:two-component system, NarL family, sensor histidine kinase UhpB
MNYQDKTRLELIKELQKLKQECDLLKTSYSKDISELRQAEDVLRESEARFRSLFENSLTGRKKSEEELRKSKELLEALNLHLQDVRENERALISREIHDVLGQSMTAIKLDLNRMYKYVNDIPDAVTQLNSMIKLVSDTIKDIQRISADLRPSILDDLGLVSAIEWYCDEFEKRTGIKCYQKLENSDYSDSKINITFFRTLQESLTNVIRHAKASSVNVRLHLTQKGTILTIIDNGIGIPEEKVESHKSLGLINMRERVRQLNGKMDISSQNGAGTKLSIFIPTKYIIL